MARWRQSQRAGQLYEGPAAWSSDYSLVPRPGFYALDASGKNMLPDVPLVCVDDAGGDPWDGACHYEFAGPKDQPQRQGRVVPMEERKLPPFGARQDIIEETAKNRGGRLVDFEVEAEGFGEVAS
jgi:hypothetical protein